MERMLESDRCDVWGEVRLIDVVGTRSMMEGKERMSCGEVRYATLEYSAQPAFFSGAGWGAFLLDEGVCRGQIRSNSQGCVAASDKRLVSDWPEELG